MENKKKLIDYAAKQGYAWVELRDADAELTVDECKEIADYARKKGIEVGYANQRALLDPDFWEVFSRGVECAQVFDGPGTIRALASGQNFINNEEKVGYTAEELDSLVANANRAADFAKKHGLQLVVENALEPLSGKGEKYFGLVEFFNRANSDVGWQLDTGNFFGVSRKRPSPKRVRTFLKEHADRLHYIHLKAAQNGETLPVLGPNPLDHGFVFDQLAQHDVPYVAFELTTPKNFKEAARNHQKSVDYLRKKGYVTVP